MKHKKTGLALVLLASSIATGTAQASLTSSGPLTVYDDVNNITWTKNANIAGKMDWSTAVAWAENLDYAGYTDWVLPTINQFTNQLGPVLSKIGDDKGHKGDKDHSGDDSHSGDDLFTNVKSDKYWSSEDADKGKAWAFDIEKGKENGYKNNKEFYALAVRSGGVATVPLPGAVWLFGSALVGLIGLKRRKNIA
ncbi:Lcl C-terminal domain-containing protein [Methylobacter psychrophilus]|uniref:Lcl C-terminal domain-containing protein n=1 Tax=Methylobacter psychrophilus TaxID=96941 RepID=UPI0021D4F02B|nr:DUF1566 domain-containing protein [Methylobacter psychrophilus]